VSAALIHVLCAVTAFLFCARSDAELETIKTQTAQKGDKREVKWG